MGLDHDQLRDGIEDSPFCDSELPLLTMNHFDDAQQLVLRPPNITGCIDVEGKDGVWSVSPLFEGEHAYLSRFCRASWSPALRGAAPDTAALDVLGRHETDVPIVTGEGSPWATAVNPTLATIFRDHIDHLVDPDALVGEDPSAVDVLVVDNRDPILPNAHSIHGAVISEIVEDIVCDGDVGCPRTVTPILAMSGIYNSVGEFQSAIGGGSFGTLGELAAGMDQALARLQASEDARVVINFSGGWDIPDGDAPITLSVHETLISGQDDPDIRIGSQAIHATMLALRCAGALPIISVGNQTPSSCQEGPKYPGAWEQLPAPTRDECVSLGFEVGTKAFPSHDQSGAYGPLIYAVGGVGYNDLPLGTARPRSTPRFVAPGQHGVGFDGGGNASDALAGTSVSAAVVSGAAALAWSYAPQLTASRLMELIYGGAVPLVDVDGQSWTSDYNLDANNGQGYDVRRVSVCKAVEAVCVEQSIGCNLDCQPGLPDLSPLDDLLDIDADEDPVVLPTAEPQVCGNSCGDGTITMWIPDGAVPPSEISVPDGTYLPDPTDPSCASCELEFPDFASAHGVAVLALDSAYAGYTQEATWIDIKYADGSSSSEFVTTALTPGVTHHVTITANDPVGAVVPKQAAVRMQFIDATGTSFMRHTPVPILLP